jgi:4-alpha-glucanotransferase
VSLDDLAGEREPVNLPGIPVERHASWSRRMQRSIDAIAASPLAQSILAALAQRARPGA